MLNNKEDSRLIRTMIKLIAFDEQDKAKRQTYLDLLPPRDNFGTIENAVIDKFSNSTIENDVGQFMGFALSTLGEFITKRAKEGREEIPVIRR